ncbi:MAG: trypsin-like peptidase domain-containing protein [Planctomycetota bacterium]
MSAAVPVQCTCGQRGTAQPAELGRQRLCARCGKHFLLWPADVAPKPSASAVWRLQVGSHELGPFEPDELRQFVHEGRITPEMLVRRGTSGPWTPARLVRGLLDAPPPAPPPPAPTPVPTTRAATTRAATTRAAMRHAGRGRSAPQRGGRRRGLAAELARQPAVLLGLVVGVLALVAAGLVLSTRSTSSPPVEPTPVATTAPPGSTPSAPPPGAAPTPKPPPAPSPPQKLSMKQLAERASPSVAVVQGRRGSGSGFLVAPGILATNRHVIEDELIANVRLQFPDAEKRLRGSYGVGLRYVDPELDLAFLDIQIDLPPLALAARQPFVRGAEVAVIGSPGALDGQILQNALARGLLSTQVQVEGQDYWQMDVAVNPGNSGGPVFDEMGQVIGVVTLKDMTKDGLGFCIPLGLLKDSLARAKTVDEAERARLGSRHRLAVIARSLLMALKGYDTASTIYLTAMQSAVAAGQEAAVGLNVAQSHVDELMMRMDGYLLVDVREHAPKLLADASLGPTTLKRVDRLYKAYTGIRRHVLSPVATLPEFKKGHEYWSYEARSVERDFAGAEGIRVEAP